jgi:hypothetical protein
MMYSPDYKGMTTEQVGTRLRGGRPGQLRGSAVPRPLHRTAPHRTAPHRTAPHRTAPHRTAPHRTAPHRTALYTAAQHLGLAGDCLGKELRSFWGMFQARLQQHCAPEAPGLALLHYDCSKHGTPDHHPSPSPSAPCQQALEDFKARIRKYEEVYEPLANRNHHYIKLIDMVTGRGYMDVNRISGYIPGKIVFFLMQVRAGRWCGL